MIGDMRHHLANHFHGRRVGPVGVLDHAKHGLALCLCDHMRDQDFDGAVPELLRREFQWPVARFARQGQEGGDNGGHIGDIGTTSGEVGFHFVQLRLAVISGMEAGAGAQALNDGVEMCC